MALPSITLERPCGPAVQSETAEIGASSLSYKRYGQQVTG